MDCTSASDDSAGAREGGATGPRDEDQMADECVIVLTTFPGDGDAAAFARTLVEERLAACVNLLPAMDSIYRWQGAVEQARERQVIMKTTSACVERLKTRVALLHPYEVPEILVLPIAGGAATYLTWIAESVV